MVNWKGRQSETPLRDVIRPGAKRGLDFVIVDELRKRTGISPESVLKFTLSEMLCNALDKDATEIEVNVREEGDFCHVEVGDNGSKKLSLEEVQMILDFESKASSKRGFLMVSRGYLGNALKCIFGYSYALAELQGLIPPDIIIKSADTEYQIALNPDRVNEVIKSEIKTIKRQDDGFTTFIVKFPTSSVTTEGTISVLLDLVLATSMVNPTRKVSYNLFDSLKDVVGSEQSSKPIRKETSLLWYTTKQFQALFNDFLRAKPETQLKEVISLFRGFTSKRVIGEILHNLGGSVNHDSQGSPVQFFPATHISNLSEKAVSELFAIMKMKSKPITKRSIASVLGFVGKESLEKLQEREGWKRLRYVMIPGIRIECSKYYHDSNPCSNLDHVEFPFLVELAVFDRAEDGKGLKVYQCVNFMASMEDIFARIFDIQYRLGRVGITKETPITVVAHLVCPVLKWLNYGKSGLDE